jgi:hypothetical protein
MGANFVASWDSSVQVQSDGLGSERVLLMLFLHVMGMGATVFSINRP